SSRRRRCTSSPVSYTALFRSRAGGGMAGGWRRRGGDRKRGPGRRRTVGCVRGGPMRAGQAQQGGQPQRAGGAPPRRGGSGTVPRSEEHTSELQSRENLVCRPL